MPIVGKLFSIKDERKLGSPSPLKQTTTKKMGRINNFEKFQSFE
jgi:hypothetical protein